MNIELHLKVTETWTLLAASVSLKCLLAMVCYLLCLRQSRISVFNVVDKITNIASMKTTWSWVLRRKIVILEKVYFQATLLSEIKSDFL